MKYASLSLVLALILVSCDATEPSSVADSGLAPLADSGDDVLAAKGECPVQCFGGDIESFIVAYGAASPACVNDPYLTIERQSGGFFIGRFTCSPKNTGIVVWTDDTKYCTTDTNLNTHNLDSKQDANACLGLARQALR